MGTPGWPDPVWHCRRLAPLHGARDIYRLHPATLVLGLYLREEVLPPAERVVV